MTLAWVDDSTATAETVDVAEDASGEPACALMIDANAEPFCSRFTRCVTGVLGLKKVTQFVLIWVIAADAAPPGYGDAVVGAAVVGAAVVGAADVLAEPSGLALPPLLHAVTAATAARTTIRNTLVGGNRI